MEDTEPLWVQIERGFFLSLLIVPFTDLSLAIDHQTRRRTQRITPRRVPTSDRRELHPRTAGIRGRKCLRPEDIYAQQGMGARRSPSLSQAIFCSREEVSCILNSLTFVLALTLLRYSILPAITMDGIIECTIVEGSFNGELFMRFIEDLLKKMCPFPAPNSVVVMDNCSIHKAPEIRELVESRCVAKYVVVSSY